MPQLDGCLDAVELTGVLSLVPGLDIAERDLTPVISEILMWSPLTSASPSSSAADLCTSLSSL